MLAAESETSILHQVSAIVSSDLSLDEMLGSVIGLTIQATACDACLVYLIDRESDEVVLRASQLPHVSALGNLRMKIGEGITGWVAEHKAVVALASGASSDARFKQFPALIEDTYEAFLSVPLVSGGELAGVVNVHHRNRHQHSETEVETVRFVGQQLGVAVAKSLLEEEKRLLQEEMLEMRLALESRKVVERAKGILQKNHGLTEEQAYLRLRDQSRKLHRPMKELAEAIVLAEDLSRQSKFRTGG
jgi:signal transduction protein with GAF and PtsI domain